MAFVRLTHSALRLAVRRSLLGRGIFNLFLISRRKKLFSPPPRFALNFMWYVAYPEIVAIAPNVARLAARASSSEATSESDNYVHF